MTDRKYELIDTHCHLTFEPLVNDIDAVLQRSIEAGVTSWVTVGTSAEDNRKVVELAGRYDNLYAAVAVHPHDAKTVTGQTIAELKTLAVNPKVVAIGETGLDYHYNHSLHEDQRRVFNQHLETAAELNLPVIIHCRKAFDETMQILDSYAGSAKKVVFHCFSGSAEQAKIVLSKGFYISFTGVVTFKNAEKNRRAAEAIPLDRLMLETDCPYMSPEPMRKQKVNEPALMIHTARFLAELKGLPIEEFAKQINETTREFFNLPV
jgi:TatD DNase family protein